MMKLKNIRHNIGNRLCRLFFEIQIEKTIKKKRTIKEHFNKENISAGHSKFLKKCRDDMYAQYW